MVLIKADNNKNLPHQLLDDFGVQLATGVRVFMLVHHFLNVEELLLIRNSVLCYHQLPSLRHQENDILLLLVWSNGSNGEALQALHDWATSQDGKLIHQKLMH